MMGEGHTGVAEPETIYHYRYGPWNGPSSSVYIMWNYTYLFAFGNKTNHKAILCVIRKPFCTARNVASQLYKDRTVFTSYSLNGSENFIFGGKEGGGIYSFGI